MKIMLKPKIADYTDSIGRMDLKPVKGNLASTNNNLLYTGELAILMHEYNDVVYPGLFDRTEFMKLQSAVSMCKVPNHQGLYSRHPEPYRRIVDKKGRVDFRPVSFDEILGAAFVATLSSINSATEIYHHGSKNYWQYNDIPGHEKGVPIWKMFTKPLSLLKVVKEYIKEAMTIGFDNGGLRKAAQYHSGLYPLFFNHAASNRVIYRAAVGKSSSLLEQIKFAGAAIVASIKSDNISTKVLWYFRFKHLEITKKKTRITRFAEWFYNKAETRRFGELYPVELFRLYYKDANHPFHTMIRLISEKSDW